MKQFLTLLSLVCRPGFAGRSDLLAKYERAFVETVLGNAEIPCLSFRRGRVALWTILRALNICPGQEVIVPAYTCEMVPAAVKFAGGRCCYCDVAQGSFNSSCEGIISLLNTKTRATIYQHTYGCIQNIKTLVRTAKASGVAVIEDCCQVVEFDSQNTGAGITGAGAFFSTQWSKPYSTGLGGLAVFSDQLLYKEAQKIRSSFRSQGGWNLAVQVLIYTLAVRPITRAAAAAMYRWAQRHRIVRGTTTMAEYGDTIPSDYLAGATNTQAVIGLQQLRKWQDNVEHRRQLTAFYLDKLRQIDVNIISPLYGCSGGRALWAIPLLVENKHQILCRAGSLGLPIASWFNRLPVHIAADTAARYDYKPGQCPQSEKLFMSEIHLLTEPAVTFKRAEKAVNLIKQYARIINC